MAQARDHRQLNLPPAQLPIREQQAGVLTKREQGSEMGPTERGLLPICEQQPASLSIREQGCDLSADDAGSLAANVFDEALAAARLTNGDVAQVLQIDESLVRKMRSPNNRESISFKQFLRICAKYPRFYVEVHIALDRRTGWLLRAAMFLQQQASAFLTMAAAR